MVVSGFPHGMETLASTRGVSNAPRGARSHGAARGFVTLPAALPWLCCHLPLRKGGLRYDAQARGVRVLRSSRTALRAPCTRLPQPQPGCLPAAWELVLGQNKAAWHHELGSRRPAWPPSGHGQPREVVAPGARRATEVPTPKTILPASVGPQEPGEWALAPRACLTLISFSSIPFISHLICLPQ